MKIDEDWFGNLTIENTEVVAKVIEKMLMSKKFSFASYIEGYEYIDLRTDQQLEGGTGGRNVHVNKYKESASFSVCDTYGVWGVSTSAHDPSQYDGTFKVPYIALERGHSIQITQLNSLGNIIRWTVTIQR